MRPRHYEEAVFVAAPPEQVFAFVDDHARLASHMSESSWMTGGGRMAIEVDDAKGQAVGSHMRLTGRVFGVRLFLDEVVTRRDPPGAKVWETVGVPKLLVIGSYRMGMDISPENRGSQLRVFIDFERPTGWATYWLGLLFGGLYSRWCVKQMLAGASTHFGAHGSVAAG